MYTENQEYQTANRIRKILLGLLTVHLWREIYIWHKERQDLH